MSLDGRRGTAGAASRTFQTSNDAFDESNVQCADKLAIGLDQGVEGAVRQLDLAGLICRLISQRRKSFAGREQHFGVTYQRRRVAVQPPEPLALSTGGRANRRRQSPGRRTGSRCGDKDARGEFILARRELDLYLDVGTLIPLRRTPAARAPDAAGALEVDREQSSLVQLVEVESREVTANLACCGDVVSGHGASGGNHRGKNRATARLRQGFEVAPGRSSDWVMSALTMSRVDPRSAS